MSRGELYSDSMDSHTMDLNYEMIMVNFGYKLLCDHKCLLIVGQYTL